MYRKEQIKWIDSGYSLRSDIWQSIIEIEDLVKMSKEVLTVGYNIYEDENWICLAQSYHADDIDGDVIRGGYFIYKNCIEERKILEE